MGFDNKEGMSSLDTAIEYGMVDNMALWDVYDYVMHPENPFYRCSSCKGIAAFPAKTCPECGSKMRVRREVYKHMPKSHQIEWKDEV